MPYKKFKNDYHAFAKEVLAEIPKQIKDFFEKKGIIPMDFKQAGNNKALNRDFELLKRKKRFEKIKSECEYLRSLRLKFLSDIHQLGFDRDDVEMIVNKGLYSLDRNIAVDLLS